jgi:hypothetical protein
MNKKPTFEEGLRQKTMDDLLELKGQHLSALGEHPKNTELKQRLESIEKTIRSRPDAPRLIKVRALEWASVDGVVFQQGQTGEITLQQYGALASRFERLD